MALLCYSLNLFSQRTFNILEQVKNNNEKPVFFAIEKDNKKAANEQTEKEFLKELYNANKDVKYIKTKEIRDEDATLVRKYQQFYKGLKVIGGSIVVNSTNEDVLYVNGSYADLNIDINPAINEQQLLDYLQQAIKETKNLDTKSIPQMEIKIKEKELLICKDISQITDKYNLAYKVYVSCKNPLISSNYYIDAITGKLLTEESLICTSNTSAQAETVFSGTKTITTDSYSGQYRLREVRNGTSIETYNLNHGLEWDVNTAMVTEITDLNNVWTYADSPVEQYAHDAHWGAEKVFDYFLQVHNRNSWDGNGGTIRSYIEYGDNFSGGL